MRLASDNSSQIERSGCCGRGVTRGGLLEGGSADAYRTEQDELSSQVGAGLPSESFAAAWVFGLQGQLRRRSTSVPLPGGHGRALFEGCALTAREVQHLRADVSLRNPRNSRSEAQR
jgi:hypothetical protein